MRSCDTESKKRKGDANDANKEKEINDLNIVLRQKDDLIISLYNEIKSKNDKIQELSDMIIKLNEDNVKHMLEKSQNNFNELSQKVLNIQQNLNSTFNSNRDMHSNRDMSPKNSNRFNTSTNDLRMNTNRSK